MIDLIKHEINASMETFKAILEDGGLHEKINKAALLISDRINAGNKLMFIGNGGSAAEAQHIAAEFVSKLQKDRKPLPALALSTDTSILTAVGNDYGYEQIFSRQIDAIGKCGDVIIALSTSGESKNILNAINAAHKNNIVSIGLSGKYGSGQMSKLVGIDISIPSNSTQCIQEGHLLIGHLLCKLSEENLGLV